jgi:RNA polymerase sigma-70 factor (ECF subfamily)
VLTVTRDSEPDLRSLLPPGSIVPLVNHGLDITEIFNDHADFVWRSLRRLGLGDADAEDALQEVFLVVHRRLPDYEERGALRAWLYTISRQVAGHYHRSRTRLERREQAAQFIGEPYGSDPHEAALRAEAAATVNAFLSELDEPQAAVFHLSEIEGLSAPEVSTALGVKLNTVYGRLRLARKRFEDFLRRRVRPEERRS